MSLFSRCILDAQESSSWIRKMFMEANELRKRYPADDIVDLSLGNPVFDPPPEFLEALRNTVSQEPKGRHRYMDNRGLARVREFLAGKLSSQHTNLQFQAEDVMLCVGAAGGLNIALNSLCNPGDLVHGIQPYFAEYSHYASQHGGSFHVIACQNDFHLDFAAISAALSKKSKVILLNSPNNPCGVIYSAAELQQLSELLRKKSQEYGQDIIVLADEPYRRIVYSGQVPSIFDYYPASIVVTSFSKDLAIPGERLGYLSVHPEFPEKQTLLSCLALSQRTLGFVNAPALMQSIIPEVFDYCVDLSPYRENRDLLYAHLRDLGLECYKPEGAFYLFPKVPGDSELPLIEAARKLKLLLVPGRAFGMPGYFRISYCVEPAKIKQALPLFTDLLGSL